MSIPARETDNSNGVYPTRETASSVGALQTIPRTGASNRPSMNAINYPSRIPNVSNPTQQTGQEAFRSTYGTESPFAILADLFLRTSTGYDPAPSSGSGVIAVDPGVSGSGSNVILIMLVLGIAAVAIWYFYFR